MGLPKTYEDIIRKRDELAAQCEQLRDSYRRLPVSKGLSDSLREDRIKSFLREARSYEEKAQSFSRTLDAQMDQLRVAIAELARLAATPIGELREQVGRHRRESEELRRQAKELSSTNDGLAARVRTLTNKVTVLQEKFERAKVEWNRRLQRAWRDRDQRFLRKTRLKSKSEAPGARARKH